MDASYVAARETAASFAPRLGTEAARRVALDIVGWRGLDTDGGGQEDILRRVAAKHLVQQRMKRAGMRWSELGARAILNVRCALLNHDLAQASCLSQGLKSVTPCLSL